MRSASSPRETATLQLCGCGCSCVDVGRFGRAGRAHLCVHVHSCWYVTSLVAQRSQPSNFRDVAHWGVLGFGQSGLDGFGLWWLDGVGQWAWTMVLVERLGVWGTADAVCSPFLAPTVYLLIKDH